MALDLKKILLSKHTNVLDSTTPANRRKILSVYGKIEDPIIYTSFMLQITRTLQVKRMVRTTPLEIYNELRDKLIALDEKKISKEVLADSVEFFDKYNQAVRIVMHYRTTTDYEIPYVEFNSHIYHSDFIKFMIGFDKRKYPLIESWDEFIMALPNHIAKSGVRQVQIGFYDYLNFVQRGQLAKWYQVAKGYGKSNEKRRTWVDMYVEELEEQSDNKLVEELNKFGWGHYWVAKEVEKRGIKCRQ